MKIEVQYTENSAVIILDAGQGLRSTLTAEGWDDAREMLLGIIETTPGVDTLILDLSTAILTFNDMVSLLIHVQREVADLGGSRYLTAALRVLVVGTGDLPEMITRALRKEKYGGFDTRLFPTRTAALAYADAILAAA